MDGLVAGAVADGDGVDAYMGGDGAADGAGAGVYVVLARERLVDILGWNVNIFVIYNGRFHQFRLHELQ